MRRYLSETLSTVRACGPLPLVTWIGACDIVAARARRAAGPALRAGCPAGSKGRLSLRAVRSTSVSTSLSSQTAIALSRISARVSALQKAPPPVAITLPAARLLDQPGDHPALAVAEIGLAESLEDLGDGHPRGFLDLLVGIDESEVQRRGKALADAGLADAHHADQHHRPVNPPRQRLDFACGRRGAVDLHCSAAYSCAKRQRKHWGLQWGPVARGSKNSRESG